MIWFGRYIQRTSGLSLLLLRVFGGEESAKLTFKGLLERWRHVGRYYTVIDRTRLRHRAEVIGWFRLIGGVNVIWLSAIVLGWQATVMVVVALLALEWWLVYFPIFRQSVVNREGLLKLLADAERAPRSSDLSFRSLEVPCFENTWRLTVAEIAGRVQVVLMDLRDYTRGRRGSEFEIDHLFDSVPLARVVFLVLPREDRLATVQQVLRHQWRTLATDSPNRVLSGPKAKLYAIEMDPPAADMQCLLDELIGMAIVASPQPTEAPTAATDRDHRRLDPKTALPDSPQETGRRSADR